MEYSDAKTLFEVGLSEDDILKIYGEPVSVMEDEILTTWYYDHNEIIKKLKDGDEWEAYLINFKNKESYSIQPIIITKRSSG